MKIIEKPTKLDELWQSKETGFIELMKIVVDIEKRILAIDAEMHSDLEEFLLKNGSKQINLWGANIYPDKDKEDFLEFTSFINIRPSQNNKSMEIQNPDIKNLVRQIVNELLIR
jgi:hypothetical protein